MTPDPITAALNRDDRSEAARKNLLAMVVCMFLLIAVMISVSAWQANRDAIRTNNIVGSLRLSIDCLTLRDEGQRPPLCNEVNERVDALSRGELPDFFGH